MAKIRAFRGLRPAPQYASEIAALPYDVYNRTEAREVVQDNPLSFLQIDRAETLLPEDVDIYDEKVYQTARNTLEKMTHDSYFIQDATPCFYIYELTFRAHTQTGLVVCASIDDYLNDHIKKHERTLAAKEQDRIHHIDTCNAQTGPIFMTYRNHTDIAAIIRAAKETPPLYDFSSEDKVGHRLWQIQDPKMMSMLESLFADIPSLYIADGHHRAASAVQVGLKRRKQFPDYQGDEEFNYFLSVLFPDNELSILPYYRIVQDLNGHTAEEFLSALQAHFDLQIAAEIPFQPEKRHEFGLYLHKTWYCLNAKPQILAGSNVDQLDVSILQNYILEPLLGIHDPRTDSRISFMGGIRGLEALQSQADKSADAVAFSLYPTAMEELLQTSDENQLMPPKSTWFEPKLRSGLLIHKLN